MTFCVELALNHALFFEVAVIKSFADMFLLDCFELCKIHCYLYLYCISSVGADDMQLYMLKYVGI